MKSTMLAIALMFAASAANAYVGDVNCKDKSGKVRISFHVDTTETDAVPQCIKQIKLDGEVANLNIGQFDDDGPIYQAHNSLGEFYSAKLKFGLKNIIFGYTTDAVVKNVETTLRCR